MSVTYRMTFAVTLDSPDDITKLQTVFTVDGRPVPHDLVSDVEEEEE